VKRFWQKYRGNRPAVPALAALTVIVLFTIFAGVISPLENGIRQDPGIRLRGPGREHIFGTDDYGRDLFTRIIHGGRVSLFLGFGAAALSMAIAFVFGSIAGYAGGLIDEIIMRIMDAVLSIPYMLLALAIVAALGPGTGNLFIAIVVSYVPSFTRIIRSVVLTITENDYITAARVNGLGDIAIIHRHIFRNAVGPVIVQAALSVTGMMLLTVGLSFIGLGVNPPVPEWGAMLSSSREFLRRAPHLMFFPAAAIVVTALSLNLVADGIRDALE
jgi:peptide/nickel transport system permease protein